MTENELLAELIKELSLPDIDPEEVTSQMLADYTGVSWSTADSTLKAKVDAGLLTKRQVKLPNRRVATAYRKAK